MKRLAFWCILAVLTLTFNGEAVAQSRLATSTGNLLRGTVYKQNGMERTGYITIRTSWRLPAIAPVFRYDFDILYGSIENTLYPYLLADIEEMSFLPIEGKNQPVTIKLRNGLMQKIMLSSDKKTILGRVNLQLKEIAVLTDGFGENIITAGDVHKIVFHAPASEDKEDIRSLANTLGQAIATGKRDGLIDDDLLVVLEKLENRIKKKANGQGEN
jgi:hypothetical protein